MARTRKFTAADYAAAMQRLEKDKEFDAYMRQLMSGFNSAPPVQEQEPEKRGFMRATGDVATKFLGGIPKAAGALVGIGSAVPGLHYVADPVSATLRGMGEGLDAALLSDYQKARDAELQARMKSDATDAVTNIKESAAGAAGYLSENPSQVLPFVAESIPSIFASGLVAKGLKYGTGLGVGTRAAVGEGAVIGGDVGSRIAEDNPDDFAARYWGGVAGVGGALLGRAGAKLSGGRDIDVLVANKMAKGEAVDLLTPEKSVFKRVPQAAATEGVLEELPQSILEESMYNIGVEKPWFQGVGGAGVTGLAAGTTMGGGMGLMRTPNSYTQGELENAQRVLNNPNASLEDQLAAADMIRRTQIRDQGVEGARSWYDSRAEGLVQDRDALLRQQMEAEMEAQQRADEEEAKVRTRAEYTQAFPYAPFKAKRIEEITNAQLTPELIEAEFRQTNYEAVKAGQPPLDPAKFEKDYRKKVTKELEKSADEQLLQEYYDALDGFIEQRQQDLALVRQRRRVDVGLERTTPDAYWDQSSVALQGPRIDVGLERATPTGNSVPNLNAIPNTFDLGAGGPSLDRITAASLDRTPVDMFTGQAGRAADPEAAARSQAQSEWTPTEADLTATPKPAQTAAPKPAPAKKDKQNTYESKEAAATQPSVTPQQARKTVNDAVQSGVVSKEQKKELVALSQKDPAAAVAAVEQLVQQDQSTNVAPPEVGTTVAPKVEAPKGPQTEEEYLAAGYTKVMDGDGNLVRWAKPEDKGEKGGPRVGALGHPTLPVPERLEDVKPYLLSAVTEEQRAAIEATRGADFSRELSTDEQAELYQLLMAEQLQRVGRDKPNKSDELKVSKQFAALTKEDETGEAPASLRVAGKKLGVAHQTVKNRALTGMESIRAAASAAGISEQVALEQLGLAPDLAADMTPISAAGAVQAGLTLHGERGAVQKVTAPSDDFDPTANYERVEGANDDFDAPVTEEEALAEDANIEEESAELGFDPSAVTEALVTYGGFVHRERRKGADVPAANELSDEQQIAVVEAYVEYGDRNPAAMWRIFEEIVDAGENVQADRAIAEDATGEGGRSSSENIAPEKTAGEPTFTAPKPTKQASVQHRKKRNIVREDGTAAEQRTSEAETTEGLGTDQRLERADAQGFTNIGYHGTAALAEDGGDFTEMRVGDYSKPSIMLGVHIAADPAIANNFSGKENGRVIKTRFRMSNPLVIDNSERGEAHAKWGTTNDDVVVAKEIAERAMNPQLFAALMDSMIPNMSEQNATELLARLQDGRGFTVGGVAFSDVTGLVRTMVDASFAPHQAKAWKFTIAKFKKESGYDGIVYQNTAASETKGATDKTSFIVWPENVRSVNAEFAPGKSKDNGLLFSNAVGSSTKPAKRTTVAKVESAIKRWFLSPERAKQVLTVVQTRAELPAHVRDLEGVSDTTQGFVYDGRAYMIASNIAQGDEMAVFMHEVGAHIGLTPAEEKALAAQVRRWKNAKRGSLERKIYDAAMARMKNAGETSDSELIAYAAEEAVNAGVKPTMVSEIGRWLRQIANMIMTHIRGELAAGKPLSTQDLVDYVYGSAGLALDLQTTPQATKGTMFSVSDQVIDAAPANLQEPLRVASDKISELLTKGVNYSTFTSYIVDSLNDVLPSAKKWYDAISRRETLRIGHEAKIDDIAEMADKLSKQQFNQTWSLIHDMTLANENGWAYKPTWKKEPVKVNTDLAKRWDVVLSEEEQAFADAVFKNGYETIRDTQAALDAIADEVFADKLANASPERKIKIEREKAKYKRMYSKKLSEIQGPYAPTRGVGSHITVGKSQLFVDTEKLAKDGDDKAAERLTELRGDPVHFRVAFSDSLTQAKQIEREYKNRFPVTTASAREYHSSNDVMPYQMFQTLRNKAEGDNGKFSRKLLNMIDDLYLQTLADTSARKSELKRVGAVDQNADRMMKAFLSKGKADAHHLAVLKTHREVADNFRDMAKQAREYNLRGEKSMAYNELARRYENSFNFDPSPTIGKLMNITALWMLLTKPAYYLYNLTQPLMMAQPYLSQAHGYGKSMRELSRAYSDLSKTQRLFNMQHFNMAALPADVRAALITLRDRGRIDITIAQDLGSRIHQSESTLSKSAAKVTGFFRHAAQKTEMMNRIVTAAAAYRLAKAAGQTEQQALDYADKAVAHTQGDYSNFNAPRLLNETNFRKLVTQFRKFQFIQIGLMLRMLKDSGFSTQEKRAATGAFMVMMGHHAVLAGAMGLPLMNVVAMAFSMMGDDDEPRDLELAMRDVFGKDAAGTFLQYGLPAALFNVNMSTNVGMGNTFSVVPFADIEWTRKGYESVVTSMMGPTFGLGAQVWDGVGKLGKGDYYGFLTSISPGVVKSSMKAVNEAANGVENTRGDVLVNPEEISFFATTAKALGLKTQDDAVRMLVRNSKFEFEKFFTSRTAELRNQYAKAYRDGDGSAMEEARNNWMELQAFKREYGFTVQPISNLFKAPMEQAKRERETAGGVQYDKTTRAFVERYVEDEEELAYE